MQGLKKPNSLFCFLFQMIQFLLAFGKTIAKQQKERRSIEVCGCSNGKIKGNRDASLLPLRSAVVVALWWWVVVRSVARN